MFLTDDATDVAVDDDNKLGFMNLHSPDFLVTETKVEKLTWKTIHLRNY